MLRGISADGSEVHVGNVQDAELVADYLRGESLGMAGTFLSHIRLRCAAVHPVNRAENRAAVWWQAWANKAELAIRLVRELGKVAYPVE